MTTRNIFGTIRKTDGSLWPNYAVKFWRAPNTYTEDDTYPSDEIITITDSVGEFSVDLWCNSEGIVPTAYICQLRGEDFMFSLQPGDPVNLTQLRDLSPGGSDVIDSTLTGWVEAEAFEVLTATYDGTYTSVVSTATVKWPDGSAGVFTTTTINTTWEAIDAFTVTHPSSGKTVIQSVVTRNANGDITSKPALTVA